MFDEYKLVIVPFIVKIDEVVTFEKAALFATILEVNELYDVMVAIFAVDEFNVNVDMFDDVKLEQFTTDEFCIRLPF